MKKKKKDKKWNELMSKVDEINKEIKRNNKLSKKGRD